MQPMQSSQHTSGDIGANPVITAAQCRAGRALIEISRADLAKAAGVGERTLADFESKARTPIRATLAAIQRALEAAGVEFFPDDGLRLKRESPTALGSP
jgi:transcriptional regulator with XRE-family HTH domain